MSDASAAPDVQSFAPAPAPPPPPAAAAAPAPDVVASEITWAIDTVKKLAATKPWRQSLTMQGSAVSGLGGNLALYGTAVASIAPGVNHAAAVVIVAAVAGIITQIGSAMAAIGRMRKGDLT